MKTPNKTRTYKFVVAFIGTCCPDPHLWMQSVSANTRQEGKQKILSLLDRQGHTAFEIADVTDENGSVETV